ncbi:hypothetical protein SG34_010320 [Thalassomonas viridans]|uniref:Uncharacterized protein n=1 Tax=Thalassomonas viridans TaxID=137584 RepID=A0AAE9Z5W2_9GAMM|nr:hypothetical protein [Thalassomonas viridans]WDE07240.1 hypothetical protein SG34_010320 [Thalassomonas viridans]
MMAKVNDMPECYSVKVLLTNFLARPFAKAVQGFSGQYPPSKQESIYPIPVIGGQCHE